METVNLQDINNQVALVKAMRSDYCLVDDNKMLKIQEIIRNHEISKSRLEGFDILFGIGSFFFKLALFFAFLAGAFKIAGIFYRNFFLG